MTIKKPFKVLIVGGGPAGLTLANALKNQGIAFKVFERDAGPQSRPQGWSFGFNQGFHSLKRYIPQHRFKSFRKEVSTDPESEVNSSLAMIDGRKGKVIFSFGSSRYESYRVNRYRFRDWLLQDVNEDVVWNKRAERYEESKDRVKVIFGDGSVEEGDLLVATDGVKSRLAQQLLSDQFDTAVSPVRGYGCSVWLTEQSFSKLVDITTQATIVVGSMEDSPLKGVCMFYTLNDVDRNRPEAPYQVFYFLSRYDPDRTLKSVTGNNNAEVMEMIKSWSSGFKNSPVHQQLILNIPDETTIMEIIVRERRPTYDSLVAPNRRVVLAGDSAHPMTMFRGNGANQAVIDASGLAGEIVQVVSGEKSLDKAIEDYYSELVPRCQRAVDESHEAAEMMHNRPDEIYNEFKHIVEMTKKSSIK